jgi:hypothetical protein
MKPINEVYPDEAKEEAERGEFYGPSDYTPLIDSMGYETLLQVDDYDYQGDSRLLLADGQRRGILIFGWGSCSGCDSLQACNHMADIEALRNRLHSDIKWFDNPTECLLYVNTHDWAGDHSWHDDETKDFVARCKTLLS